MKIPKQAYTTEFKELAVKRSRMGRASARFARNSGWATRPCATGIKASAEGKLNGAGSRVVTPEEMELSRLRAENLRLKRENEILKKATAYFARDVL
jgi:transposase